MKRIALFLCILSLLVLAPFGCSTSNTRGTNIENPGPSSSPGQMNPPMKDITHPQHSSSQPPAATHQ